VKTKKPSASFDQALTALSSDRALPTRVLKALNRLDDDQLSEFLSVYTSLDDNRRAYLIAKLRAMAEVDVQLDYTGIFRSVLIDVDERVRRTAIDGLGEDEDTNLIDVLVVLLRSDPSTKVRAAAAKSLGRFMYLSAMDKLNTRRHDQVYSALMGTLLNSPEDSPVRRAALRSLAHVSNDEVELHIRDAYASDDMPLRISAVYAMGRSSDHKYQQAVMNELHSVAPAMRREAARASGELEIREAVHDLGMLVDDPDEHVRKAALAALGQIGGDEAKQILERATHSDEPSLARAAEDALAEYQFLYSNLKFSVGPFDELLGDTLTP